MGADSHVEAPDSIGALADQDDDPVRCRVEPPNPIPEGQGVVLAETFDISHMKASLFRFADRDMPWNEPGGRSTSYSIEIVEPA